MHSGLVVASMLVLYVTMRLCPSSRPSGNGCTPLFVSTIAVTLLILRDNADIVSGVMRLLRTRVFFRPLALKGFLLTFLRKTAMLILFYYNVLI